MAERDDAYEGWTILELLGRRKLGGYVRETTIAGAGMLRIDVFDEGPDPVATQFFSPGSVYAMTPSTESLCRGLTKSCRPAPVARYELPAPARRQPTGWAGDEDDDPGFDPDDEA